MWEQKAKQKLTFSLIFLLLVNDKTTKTKKLRILTLFPFSVLLGKLIGERRVNHGGGRKGEEEEVGEG